VALFFALFALRQQLVLEAGISTATALRRGLYLGWLDDALVVVLVGFVGGVSLGSRARAPWFLWSLLAGLAWIASLANVAHYRYFDAPLGWWVVRFHYTDVPRVLGAAAEPGWPVWQWLGAALLALGIVARIALASERVPSEPAPPRSALRFAAVAVGCGVGVWLLRALLFGLSAPAIEPGSPILRTQVVALWVEELLGGNTRSSGWDWRRATRQAQLIRATEDAPSADEQREMAEILLRFQALGADSPARPEGAPEGAAPRIEESGRRDAPLYRELRTEPSDARALRRHLGLDPERPVSVVLLMVESLRAFELQHPEIGPAVFPELRERLTRRAIWFEQAYSSAFRAGQTVRGQWSAKCSWLPNFLGVAAYIGYPDLRASCLPDLFAARGASTYWLHTTDAQHHNNRRFEEAHGTQHVLGGEFFSRIGVDQTVGDWGLADGPFLAATLDLLRAALAERDQVFATVLTVSSHAPYRPPPGVELPRPLMDAAAGSPEYLSFLAVLRYVDGQVAGFLDALFASEIGDRVLVVLVGDHSVGIRPHLPLGPSQESELRFRVPLALVSRSPERPARVAYPVHQIDIAPTVARIAGLEGRVSWLGRDLLSGSGSPWLYLDEEQEELNFRAGDRACYTLAGARGLSCFSLADGVDPLFGRGTPVPSDAAEVARFEDVARAASRSIVQDLIVPSAPRPGPQLWAHRGFHGGDPARENTVEALLAADRIGFPGVELDLFWWRNRLVVRHDPPEGGDDAAAAPALADFLDVLPPRLQLYLDFKNLTARNAPEVARPLRELLERRGALGRTYVESKHPDALAALRRVVPGVNTLLWITDPSDREAVRAAVERSGTHALSLEHSRITEAFLRDFADLLIHTFTVNDAERARALARAGVDVILTDEDFSTELPELMRRD